jgi:Holliday junction resolvase RusA-like endonuclease
MTPELTFTTWGRPIGQGAHRTSATGHTYEITKGHAPWRKKLINSAREAMEDWTALDGPVDVMISCFGPRPKSHYGTGRNALVLKASAPAYPVLKGGAVNLHDVDHLARSVLDALKLAEVITDDARVVDLFVRKRFARRPDGARATVTVWPHIDDIPETYVHSIDTLNIPGSLL